MPWGSKVHATKLTNITSEVFFDSEISLGVGDYAHVQFKGDFHINPAGHLHIKFFSTLDSSGEQWDSLPFITANLDSAGPVISFIIRDYYKFRVSVFLTDTTDPVDLDMWHRVAS